MTNTSLRQLFGHLNIRVSFVLRHSCFVISIISVHSAAIPRLFSSRGDSQLTFPFPPTEAIRSSLCAASERVPIPQGDITARPGEWRRAMDESPDRVVFPARPGP